MCGIAGCVGHEGAPEFVIDALEALEYRGYDSAGIAIEDAGRLQVIKTLGDAATLCSDVEPAIYTAQTAIGHTRWATHGEVSMSNGHPHVNEAGTIAVVCNGTIENYQELKADLQLDGYTFSSETDTEVVPHLFDRYLRDGAEPDQAFRQTLKQLVGAYAIVALASDAPGTLYAARVSSPLVLGVDVGKEGHFAASDPAVLIEHTKKAVFLEDYDVATLRSDGYEISHLKNGRVGIRVPQDIGEVYEKANKGDYPHYMLKEIHDSPETILAATRGRVRPQEGIIKLGGLESVKERLRSTERIIIVACGTSYYAGLIGESLIEEIADLPVEVQAASEFKYKKEPLDKNTAIIAISQSGETADTIAALEKADEYGLLKLGIVNAPGSTISRITDAGVYCHAGPEVSVASTKAFTSQVTVLTEIAMSLAKRSNKLSPLLMAELTRLPEKIEAFLSDQASLENIQMVAKKYAAAKNFLFIGRGYNYPNALEGALKLKEISYIHAEGYSAGEMKHGPLAMIDEDFPTVAIVTDSPQFDKTMSNVAEIKARKGAVIALATEGNMTVKQIADDVIYVPKSLEQTQPLLNGIALQLFAYYVAVEKGMNVDRPRNLAKSVTVE